MVTESHFQGEELPMIHNNPQYVADVILTGAYDQLLPRPEKDVLTVRQVAARYSKTRNAAVRDEIVASAAIGVTGGFLIGWMCFIKYMDLQINENLTGAIIAGIVLSIVSTILFAVGANSVAINFKWFSSRRQLHEYDVILKQVRDDMKSLSAGLGLSGYESLRGYDRKMLANMALEAGAQLYASGKQLMNSDDVSERNAAARLRTELDEFHALLCRLGLQPKGGYPAYGRLAAETT